MVPVELWVTKRLWTLGATAGQAVTRVDVTADRLAIVLQRLRDDEQWNAFAAALHQHTVRATARISALPQGKVRQAVLDPFGDAVGHRGGVG